MPRVSSPNGVTHFPMLVDRDAETERHIVMGRCIYESSEGTWLFVSSVSLKNPTCLECIALGPHEWLEGALKYVTNVIESEQKNGC